MKYFFTILVSFFGIFYSFSQETPTKEVDEIIEDIFNEDNIIDELMASFSKYQFLYISTNYNSNTYFSGRDIGIDQYNIRPQITYVHSKGFYASVSGTYYSEFDPQWDVTLATVGFGKNLDKNKLFKYNLSYSRYFYANSIDNIYTNSLSVGLGVQDKNRSIGTQISANYLFGSDQTFQVSSRSYFKINLLEDGNTTLNLRPQLNIVAGKETVELSRISTLNGVQTTQTYANDVFTLINTQVKVPLQLNLNSFDFELGYNINFPTPIGDETNLKSTSFFNFSIGYLISL